MYKNFSYIFGLGALFMLAACDSGDKKSADGKESVAKSQEAVTKIREIQRIKKVSGNKQENNKGTAVENPDEEYGGIYADINRPIEDETPTSAKNNNVNANANKNTETKTESVKVSETAIVSAIDGVTKPEKNGKKEAENSKPAKEETVDSTKKSENSEPVKEAAVDSTKKSENSEPAKEVAVNSTKKSENSEPAKETDVDSIKKSDSEIKEEISKTENNQNADNINREDKVDTASEIREEVSTANNGQSDAKETHIDDANRENTEHEENSLETPEVSMVSDVPVISEESSENQPVETDLIEIDQISESIPNEAENTEAKSIEG